MFSNSSVPRYYVAFFLPAVLAVTRVGFKTFSIYTIAHIFIVLGFGLTALTYGAWTSWIEDVSLLVASSLAGLYVAGRYNEEVKRFILEEENALQRETLVAHRVLEEERTRSLLLLGDRVNSVISAFINVKEGMKKLQMRIVEMAQIDNLGVDDKNKIANIQLRCNVLSESIETGFQSLENTMNEIRAARNTTLAVKESQIGFTSQSSFDLNAQSDTRR